MADKTEYEIGYINGFYASLKSVEFIAGLPGTTTQEILEGTSEVLNDMRDSGDAEYIRSGVDGFIEAAQAAEDAGKSEEFLDFLDTLTENKNK